MAKPNGASFTRRAPDNITEELVALLSKKTAYEFKALFEIIFTNLRARNAASGGEEMLRLRCYEKLQSLVAQGAVKKTVNGLVKKYQGVAAPLRAMQAEMEILRTEWTQKLRLKAEAAAR